MKLGSFLPIVALAGCVSNPDPSQKPHVQKERTEVIEPVSLNPYAALTPALSEWGDISWTKGTNESGPAVLLVAEMHYEPDQTGKDRSALGRLHRELFELEKALISGGHTKRILSESNFINDIAAHAQRKSHKPLEYVQKLRQDKKLQEEFTQVFGYNYTSNWGDILEVAFNEELPPEQKYTALSQYIGRASSHALITAIYGNAGVDLEGVDTVNVDPIVNFLTLHNAVANNLYSMRLSDGRKKSLEQLRAEAQARDGESMILYCNLRVRYEAARLEHNATHRKREQQWEVRIGETQNGLVVMLVGANHISQLKTDLLPKSSWVGSVRAKSFTDTLKENGLTETVAFSFADDQARFDRVWNRELPDLVLITRDGVKEGCKRLLERVQEMQKPQE